MRVYAVCFRKFLLLGVTLQSAQKYHKNTETQPNRPLIKMQI